ncbi:alpha/beta hydrolase [Neorhodopirellula pilleata]|nr:alpha/beta hydrolase [Neorhodopirellula pilleata]
MFFRLIVVAVFASIGWASVASTALAQPPGVRKPAEDPALTPRREVLTTKDKVKINAFYFPSKEGKKAVPVIVVHEWKGQAGPYMKLFLALRESGFAVVALEYRGHGTSKTYTDERGTEQDFNIATMGRRDVEAIIRYDIEEVKQFLKAENNAGRLNLNALSLVGIGEGAIMAGYWASVDWKIPSVGRMKQGQDVKALVYVSPEKNLNGMAMVTPMQDPNLVRLPTLILAGKASPQGREAEKIGSRLETVKKKLNRGVATGYELFLPSTNLSGAALINDEPTAIPKIVTFLKENVDVSDSANEWIDRP